MMANHAIRDLVSETRGGFFSIICDEYTDISNKEQLIICIRWVDKELETHEDFLGFYNVPDIGAETIVSAIKDELLKLRLFNSYPAKSRGISSDTYSHVRSYVYRRISDGYLRMTDIESIMTIFG